MKQRRLDYETARLRLSRYRIEGQQARTRGAQYATEVSASALGVERVGVWLLGARGEQLQCASQFSRASGQHTSGQLLLARRYPRYVGALMERRIIAAENARTHESTRELSESYLEPAGITSMLDAPIIREGRVVGVVCHEHVGPPRSWSDKDLAFASSVADMVTLIFEQADRLELEAAPQEQAELRQESQKMEALGRLATAVAHDFNNLLSAVALGTRAFARSQPEQLRETAKELADMVGIGQRLCRQLLDFGRQRSEPVLGVVQLHEVVERLLPVIRAGLGRGVALALHSSASDPRIRGDASQIEQVVLNLALNARDAVEGDGRIDIELRDAMPADEVSPECVVLEVRDNGTGMDEATRARLFEPFFTTKGQRSGLGLATVYGVVKRCGGIIRATSEPAAGTVMFVALPRALTT